MRKAWHGHVIERRFIRSDTGDPVQDELVHYLSIGALTLAALLGVLFVMQYVGFPEIIGGPRGIVFPISFLVAYAALSRGYVRSVGLLLVASVLALLYSKPPLIVAGTIVAYAIIVTGLAVSPRAMFLTAAISPLLLLHASLLRAGHNFLLPLTVGFSTFDPERFDVDGAVPSQFLPTFGGTVVVVFVFASTTFFMLRRVQAAATAQATHEVTRKANRELAELNLELEHLATHDSLTNLTNRSSFMAALETSIEECRRERQSLSLMFVDLDGFKAVNDDSGHHTGDYLLQRVAARLSQAVDGVGAEIARLGGDEFVVRLMNDPNEETAVRVGRAILEALAQPFSSHDKELLIGCCIGIAMFPDHAHSASGLLRRADLAMYEAKRKGRNRLEVSSAAATGSRGGPHRLDRQQPKSRWNPGS